MQLNSIVEATQLTLHQSYLNHSENVLEEHWKFHLHVLKYNVSLLLLDCQLNKYAAAVGVVLVVAGLHGFHVFIGTLFLDHIFVCGTPSTISDSICCSAFSPVTGFHGFHVIKGTLFSVFSYSPTSWSSDQGASCHF